MRYLWLLLLVGCGGIQSEHPELKFAVHVRDANVTYFCEDAGDTAARNCIRKDGKRFDYIVYGASVVEVIWGAQ